MKRNLKKTIETFVYGALSLMFSAAFFFGVLYSDGGIFPSSYRVTEKPKSASLPMDGRGHAEGRRGYDAAGMLEDYEREQIRYTSFIYECLKKS